MIYLDHAATTPLDPRVYDAMLPHLSANWGNPSSPHAKGREARAALDTSRQTIADLLNVKPEEVIFVSNGSEGNTLAIFGLCEKWEQKQKTPGHAIFLSVEHNCSIKSLMKLRERGWATTMLPVNADALLDPEELKKALRDDTAIVSVQWANNEVGTIQPIEECHRFCKERGIPFHTDAVQPMGQLPLPVLPELATIAAHKFYGPKGIGALIVRDHIELTPQILGGGQEFGLRAGSENVPAIVGMAKALEIAFAEQVEEFDRLTKLRDQFIVDLEKLPGVTLNGPRGNMRLPNNVNVRIRGRKGETVVMQMDLAGICAATGAACVSGSSEPSHVLQAMGRDDQAAEENIRMTFGRSTTEEDLQETVKVLRGILS